MSRDVSMLNLLGLYFWHDDDAGDEEQDDPNLGLGFEYIAIDMLIREDVAEQQLEAWVEALYP